MFNLSTTAPAVSSSAAESISAAAASTAAAAISTSAAAAVSTTAAAAVSTAAAAAISTAAAAALSTAAAAASVSAAPATAKALQYQPTTSLYSKVSILSAYSSVDPSNNLPINGDVSANSLPICQSNRSSVAVSAAHSILFAADSS